MNLNRKDRLAKTIVHSVKQGDTARKFQDHLTKDGVSIDLTDGSVKFVMRTLDGVVLIDADATVLQIGTDQDTDLPNVEYQPVEGDLDTIGTHNAEWHCHFADETKLTLPQKSYNRIEIFSVLSES